jgi:hypothetical protein
MRVFAGRIDLALYVAMERPHDADPRKHSGSAQRRHQDQCFHSRFGNAASNPKPISSFAASRLAHQPLNSTENQQYPSDHRDRTKIEGLEETGAHQCERCSDRVAPFELCPTPEAYFRPSGLPRAVFGDQDTASQCANMGC